MTIKVFLYLQLLDLVTTLVGFKLGAGEASPFIQLLMCAGPTAGVAASKVIAVGLAALCVYLRRQRLIRFANYWYGSLVLWNVGIIILSASRRLA